MAIDMNDDHRTNMRIDQLKDWVQKRFAELEDRRRSEQDRALVLLTIAMTLVLIYALAKGFKWL
jgi:hypothetical protein